MPDQALEVWQEATKFYRKSYLAWLTHVDIYIPALSLSNSLSESRLTSRAVKKTKS